MNFQFVQRSPWLDSVRIFAALWVLLFHWEMVGVFAFKDPIEASWWPSWLKSFSHFGFLGVDIFFILSGAVVGQSAMARSSSVFVRSRFLRLFPTYVIAASFAIIFKLFEFPGDFRLAYLTSLIGVQLWSGDPNLLDVAWTLKYEVEWYALLGLAIYVCERFLNRPLDLDLFRKVLNFILVTTLLLASLNTAPFSNLLLLPFTYYFIFGAACRQLALTSWDVKWLPLVLISGTLSSMEMARRTAESIPSQSSGVFKYVLGYSLLIAMTLLLAFESRGLRKFGRLSKLLQVAALMTYPIYLLHRETGIPWIALIHASGVPTPVAMLLSLMLLLTLSFLIVRYLDPLARSYITGTKTFLRRTEKN